MATANFDEAEAVAFAKEFLSTNVLLADIMKHSDRLESEAELERNELALRKAADNPDTNDFDVLVSLAASILRDMGRLPDFLAAFAADVLEGKRKRPTKRGADPYANWERDYTFWRATEEVAKAFDLQYYSNNEFSKQTTSAEIVSNAARCSTDIVVTAYKKFKRLSGVK